MDRRCGHADLLAHEGAARVWRLDRLALPPAWSAESPVTTRFEAVEAMAARKLPIILVVLLAASVGLTAAYTDVAGARRLSVTAWSWPGTSRPCPWR
jgi:hypothetical protein